MQVIYVDVLLFFNFCVNYFLLRGTAFLTHTPCRIPRCLLSALLGSFSALIILLPPLPLAVNLLIRLGTAAGMNGQALHQEFSFLQKAFRASSQLFQALF